MPGNDEDTGTLTLNLLDSAQGHPVQSWRFDHRNRITIGRADDNDLALTDPQVSRLHVELLYRGERWLLLSHGRNGTRIDGVQVTEVELTNHTIFQLGTSGPSFQFLTARHSAAGLATVANFDPSSLDFLVIDEQRKLEEVERITEGDAFRQLLEQSNLLRRGKDSVANKGT
jgi:pSer/pThr/pTyr-binding forkhead associated (FHA) protein